MDLLRYRPASDAFAARHVLVTGASDGIGRAVALELAAHGATVIALDKKRRRLETLYDHIVEQGWPEPALFVQDLTELDADRAMAIARGVAAEFDRIDGLLHNAAELGVLAPLHAHDLALWSRIMQVNLHAPYLLTRAMLPLLRRSESASVVFTSADVGRRGRAYWGAYAVAYAGVEGLVQVWSDELEANTRIRINSLDPGPVRTTLRNRAYPGEDSSTLLTPEQVTPAYLYLLGPDSESITGQALSAQAGNDTGSL